MYQFIRPLIFKFDPETAHYLTFAVMRTANKLSLLSYMKPTFAPKPAQVMGLTVDNPVGLAAGLDKNAENIDALAALGFGFIEVGTITPRPQAGNPQPRIFRIPEHEALINRMGFNNEGVDYLVSNVKRSNYSGILGINIGKNKDTPNENAVDDYLHCLKKVYEYASYITVNLSSPNTPGLRDLQLGEPLKQLLASLKEEQAKLEAEYRKKVPLAIKVAPDMAQEDIEDVAGALMQFDIEGLIATNTTISRVQVESSPIAKEAGGLSGAPVNEQSSQTIKAFSEILGDKVDIIGVGGITDRQSAKDKVDAGAKVVQIYSGFIYKGPELIKLANDAF